jgi:hypothetical protein
MAAGAAPFGAMTPGAARLPRKRWSLRSPEVLLLIVAVAIAVILIALFTIPVPHTLEHTATVSEPSSLSQFNGWFWSFPSGVTVNVTWSGPAGETTNLTMSGGLGTYYSQTGTSGSYSFTAQGFAYLFSVSINGSGTVHVTAKYQAPVL